MIVLIGESGSGKSTIEKELVKNGLKKITSYTTRPIRDGEKDGVDYHYITTQTFNGLVSEGFFAEHVIYNSWNYGIAKKDCLNKSVVVVEPYGFRQLQKIKGLSVISFYIKVPEKIRLIRLAERGDDTIEIFRRIISDRGVFQGLDKDVNYVLNGTKDIQDSVNKILSVQDDIDDILRCIYD